MVFNRTNIPDNIEDLLHQINNEGCALLIDKPMDWTSFDVVAKIRNKLRIKKIGHAGTLDPLADGLLILCLGKFTKKINQFQDLPKEYIGKVKIGATTKSFDREFEEENIKDISEISDIDVIRVAESFLGEQEQTPPMFSAKKVKGKRLYEYARKEQEIEVKSSLVNFYEVKCKFDSPFIEFRIKCSKGTYIRSFARDIGIKLNTGGYLSSLRRSKIGDFDVKDAMTITDIIELKSKTAN